MRTTAHRVILVAALGGALGAGLALVPAAARACSPIQPGNYARTVWPDGSRPIPTNARIVVSYQRYDRFEPSSLPPVGPDLSLRGPDAAEVATEIVVDGSQAVVQPRGELQPNSQYQLLDRQMVPCDEAGGACQLTAEPHLIGTFLTGAGPDRTPPQFGGLGSLQVEARQSCHGGGCCSDYDGYPIQLSWSDAGDDQAGDLVRYNVYRAGRAGMPPEVVARLVEPPGLRGFVTCSPRASSTDLQPGVYLVRAVDWALNEDSNTATRTLRDPCDTAGCAVAGSQTAGPRRALWTAGFALAIILAAWPRWRARAARNRRPLP